MLTSSSPAPQRVGLKMTSAPAEEPVDLSDDIKPFLRIDGSDDDTLLTTLGKVAREMVEKYTHLKLINQTWEMWLDRFPENEVADLWWDGVRTGHEKLLNAGLGYIDLPFAPISSFTSLVTYDDSNTPSTFAASNYTLDDSNLPGRLYLNEGSVWPTDLRPRNSIVLTAVYGYGADGTNVPNTIKHAILTTINWLYENRGDCDTSELPAGIGAMLDAYRIEFL